MAIMVFLSSTTLIIKVPSQSPVVIAAEAVERQIDDGLGTTWARDFILDADGRHRNNRHRRATLGLPRALSCKDLWGTPTRANRIGTPAGTSGNLRV